MTICGQDRYPVAVLQPQLAQRPDETRATVGELQVIECLAPVYDRDATGCNLQGSA
jgi:hypothetical protein